MEKILLKDLKNHSQFLESKDIVNIIRQIFENDTQNTKVKSTHIDKYTPENKCEKCIFALSSNKMFDKNTLTINSEHEKNKTIIKIISLKSNSLNKINKTTLYYYIKSQQLVVPVLITYKDFEGKLHNETHAAYREFIYENGKTFVMEKFLKHDEAFKFNHIEEVKYNLPSYKIEEIKFTHTEDNMKKVLAEALTTAGINYADFRISDYSISKELQAIISLETNENIPDKNYIAKEKYNSGFIKRLKDIFK